MTTDQLEAKHKKLISFVNELVELVNKLERRIEHKQKPSTIRQLTGEDE
jgi:hypothetical protein